MSKRILTLEDLIKFCYENNVVHFDASEKGYALAVKVPATFEEVETDDAHRGLMKLKFRLFHLLENRNKSAISREAADDAIQTIKNRPILAAIHTLASGEEDFASHEIEITEDEEGNSVINYIEKQIGSLSSEEPFYEHDDKTGKDWVCTYGYIPEEYTHAADIIRRKNGTKNSVELSIEKMSFDAKSKVLNLDKFYLSGTTLLGTRDDGTPVNEGMEGSRADIADFSQENNGVVNKIESGSPVSIQENYEEGGKDPMKFEELLEKYGKTIEDIEFEYEGLSDEELEAAFAEAFDEAPVEQESDSQSDEFEESFEEEVTPKEPEQFEESYVRTYELSHSDVRTALYALLSPYEEADQTLYWINEVYDDHFVYSDWSETKYWDQKYIKNGDTVEFSGEREERFAMMVSASEKAQIESMRSNYDEISEKLAKYEAEPAKMEILNSESYSQVAESEEFSALMNDHFDLSVDEVRSKADSILLEYAKHHSLKFDADDSTGRKAFVSTSKKSSRYGNLFSGK